MMIMTMEWRRKMMVVTATTRLKRLAREGKRLLKGKELQVLSVSGCLCTIALIGLRGFQF